MNNNDIMVSIICTVFNHEKYLRKCLDGFVEQKTNFKYEVLIHDDASTDSSADIIREYEAKYPDLIKPIYQTENQYSKGIKIWWTYLFPRAKGKYIALCEGDDYWCDKYKLQRQFDALEKHSDCVFCTHKVRNIFEDGTYKKTTIPSFKLNNIKIPSASWIRLLCTGMPFQTSSYFFRSEIVKKCIDSLPKFISVSKVGDVPLMLLYANEGKCLYIDKEMSCYRNNSVGSWSNTQRSLDDQIFSCRNCIERMESFDEYSDYKYSKWVNISILRSKLNIETINNRYKSCFKKEYRSILYTYTLKNQLSFIFFALFPFLRPVYKKLRYKQ